MRIAFDTNILAYLAGIETHDDDAAKIARIKTMRKRLAQRALCVAPTQALGELYVVHSRHHRDRDLTARIVETFAEQFQPAAASVAAFAGAVRLASEHRLQFWDSLILATASDVGCELLLSEDMQHGFVWRGLTVTDPFADAIDPKLRRLLEA